MSKEFIFDVKLRMKAEINDSPIDDIHEDAAEYVIMDLIQSFLSKLVKHPKAVLKYYKSAFVETVIANDYLDLEKVKEHLDYREEPNELFVEIAAECQPDVKTFISKLYKKGSQTNGIQKNRNEFFRDTLEDHFGHPRVDGLIFDFMVPPPTDKNDETS